MPDLGSVGAEVRLGLLVNPVAGMGGAVGLKGTDGAEVLARARALGATPRSGERARAALAGFMAVWPPGRPRPALLTAGGPMGGAVAEAAGYPATVALEVGPVTTAQDTRHAALALRDAPVDLLLFAGGDGTARDVSDALGDSLASLGIPAGVKVQSAVFATSPGSAGAIAAGYLASPVRRTAEGEVVDLDEDAYRASSIVPRLYGSLRVPQGRLLQSRKAPTPAGEQAAMAGIAAAVAERLGDGRPCILGPGTTTRAIATLLGLPKTLVGVDVVRVDGQRAALLVEDAGEADLLRVVGEGPATIVLTPIGGQGFLLGRGNQQLSPAVVRAVGRDGLTVVATPGKLAALGGRPLLLDTGDERLDRELSGYIRVISGSHDSAMAALAAA